MVNKKFKKISYTYLKSESMKLFSTYKLIPSTQNSTNVDSLELHLHSSGYIG